MPVSTDLDTQAYENFLKRAKGLKAENKPKSVRQAIFDAFPDIQRAINEGLTRQEVYDRLLTPELKEKIKPSTFMGYYHLAKKAHEAEMAKKAREAKKAEKEAVPVQPAVSENREKAATPDPAPSSPSGEAVQKAMQAVKTHENNGTGIPSVKAREV